ncbi:MAG: hypothetical protein NWF04_07010 [Candidatus Bathyarchaeota archaeon]|nr:hypothetical protein [Candidatus Bathyarchaeota archaeon]
MSAIDLNVILLGIVINVVIDLIIFKLFRLSGITLAITFLVDFLLPYLPFMFLLWSRPDTSILIEAVIALVSTYVLNLVNFAISAVFGYAIAVVLYFMLGERVPEPTF